jgi:hypothetical protein
LGRKTYRRGKPPITLDLEKDPIAAHIWRIEFRPKALACALVLATRADEFFSEHR